MPIAKWDIFEDLAALNPKNWMQNNSPNFGVDEIYQ